MRSRLIARRLLSNRWLAGIFCENTAAAAPKSQQPSSILQGRTPWLLTDAHGKVLRFCNRDDPWQLPGGLRAMAGSVAPALWVSFTITFETRVSAQTRSSSNSSGNGSGSSSGGGSSGGAEHWNQSCHHQCCEPAAKLAWRAAASTAI